MAEIKEEEGQIQVFENVDNALNAGEAFVESHQKPIAIGVAVVLLVVLGIFALRSLYFQPREAEAKEAMFRAEQMFAIDSFRLALEGNDEMMGFVEIADEYGCTDAGNAAAAYAGLCYKQLGEFENAITYLSKFDADDEMIQPAVVGSIGDCYWDLGEADKAVSYYEKAAKGDNEITTPFYNKRAALVYLQQGKNDKALSLLEGIVAKYPQFPDINEVQKFIEVAKSK